MFDTPIFQALSTLFAPFVSALQERFVNPLFWLQFAIMVGVYFLSRQVLAPQAGRLLDWLDGKSAKVAAFSTVIGALKTLLIPAIWLLLQWLAIMIARGLGWPNHALTIIASLLSAWLLIRLVTLLIRNPALGRVVALVAWTVAALNIFGLLSPVMSLLDSWAFSIGQTRISPLTLIKTGLALWFSLWLANALSALTEKRLESSKTVTPAMRVLIAKLTRIVLILGAIVIALDGVGIDLTALAVFSGALGVGLGFGLQKIFSNLVSGVILLLDHSIKPGDVITLGSTFGWINHLGARYVSVITRDGIEHLIPNEDLIANRVENWSYSDNLVRLRVPIGIAYHCDPRKAIRLCVEAAKMVPRVQLEPPPRCQMMGFGDSSVNLELRIWINDPPNGRANVISEVLLNVWDAFHENDIEIPFPQRDLHIRSVMGEKELSRGALDWLNDPHLAQPGIETP